MYNILANTLLLGQTLINITGDLLFAKTEFLLNSLLIFHISKKFSREHS